MILLVGFLLIADTLQVSGSFGAKFTIKLPSLGVLNLGYTNPALAQGLSGFILNPAALSEIEHLRMSTAVGLGSETEFELRPILDMGEEIGFVEIPCDLSFTQPASMNMVSVGINHKGWVFGLGFIEELGIGARTDGNVTFGYVFSDTISYDLTHTDIPEIPEQDTIPIALTLVIPIETALRGGAGFDYSENKLFLGVARSLGWFKTGIGVVYKPIRGRFWGGLGADVNASCTLKCTVTPGEWKGSITGYTTIRERVFDAGGEVQLRGDEFNLLAGITLDFGILRLAGTLEAVPKTILNLQWETRTTHINGLPGIDSIYVDSIYVDTVKKEIGGVIGIRFSDFPDTTKTGGWKDKYEVEGRLGIGVGGALKVGPFTAGAALGVNTSREFYASVGLESRLLFPLRVDFGLGNKVYQINGGKILFPPYTVLGIGSSMTFKDVRIDFGLRTNSFGILASLIEAGVEADELPQLFELFSPAIGININFE